MSRLDMIVMFVLQFQGVRGEPNSVFHRPGHEALLPCDVLSTYDPSCSGIDWLHGNRQQRTLVLVEKGNVLKSRVQAARLHLKPNCSLLISNVMAEDAGQYVCRLDEDLRFDQQAFLNILTISLVVPDPEVKISDDVTLQCSLLSYSSFPCRMKSLRWLDEEGNALIGQSVVHKVTQDECVLNLTVSRHQNTRFTCQVVDKNNEVKIAGDYELVSTDHLNVIVGVTVALLLLLLLLLVVGAVVVIRCRKRTKREDGLQTPIHLHEETENNTTYTTVSHFSQNAPHVEKDTENDVTYTTLNHGGQSAHPVAKAKQEEAVTYSTVKTRVKAEVDASLK